MKQRRGGKAWKKWQSPANHQFGQLLGNATAFAVAAANKDALQQADLVVYVASDGTLSFKEGLGTLIEGDLRGGHRLRHHLVGASC